MILMATSLPVGICLASLTLAKLPLPMVLSSRYLPMCGSSPVRRPDTRELGSPWQMSNFNIKFTILDFEDILWSEATYIQTPLSYWQVFLSPTAENVNQGYVEGRKWLPCRLPLSPLQECATIKCDHQGIWEGSAGSLCLAPAQERVVSGRKNPHSTTFLVQQSKLCESRASQTCIREPGGTIIPVGFMKVRWFNIN